MNRRRGGRVLLAVGLMVGVWAGGTTSASAGPTPIDEPGVTRLAGADRYATAAAVSAATWAPPVPVVYVATGADFPDALGAGPAAAHLGGPVLLVPPSSIPDPVKTELARLRPERIVVLGGPTVVSTTVETALADYAPTVSRLYGADRYATAALAATTAFTAPVPVAYVASGAGYADALAGGAAAAHERGPILLTRPGSLPPDTSRALAALQPRRIVIVGGTGAVGTRVASALDSLTTGAVTRVAGTTRYDTAAALATTVFGSADTVVLASGRDFPDALAAGPTAAVNGAPLLLAEGPCVSGSTAEAATRLGATRTIVVGGTAVVSPDAASFRLCTPSPVSLRIPESQLTTEPGYALVDGTYVLLPQRFVPVARVNVPASFEAWTPLLQIRLDVTVPERQAFTARAWCHPQSGAPESAPGDDTFGMVLVMGSNPHPGTSATATASRQIQGRLPITVPPGAAMSCELQVSPRTEGTGSSWLRIDSGSWTITPRLVAAVGLATDQVVIGPGPGAAGMIGRFASTGVATDPSSVRRAYGDVMLTNCYAGYSACSVEGPRDAVVDATVVLVRRTVDKAACRVARGPTVRIVVTTLQHHRHVSLPPASDTAAGSCGVTVGAFIEVRHVSGNSVEVESTVDNRPPGAQTLSWMERFA